MQSNIVGNDCFFYLLGNVPGTVALFYFRVSLNKKCYSHFAFTTLGLSIQY